MNNYSVVFSTIKQHCQDISLLEPGCFDRVISEIQNKKTLNSPYQYLDILRDMGLIKYCLENKLIGLTDKGKNTESLFGG